MQTIFLTKIDSTNTYAKLHVQEFDQKEITCIIAEEQTHGRGRFDRRWESQKGNLFTTFFFCLPPGFKALGTLGLVLAVSTAGVLQKLGLRPQIRWPNDLLLNDKKTAGILCETNLTEDSIQVFLGIGININTPVSLPGTTSLREETSRQFSVREILKLLQNQFAKDLALLLEEGFAPFLPAMDNLLAYKNREISYHDSKHLYHGVLESLSSEGFLNLRLPSGELQTISSGDFVQNDHH